MTYRVYINESFYAVTDADRADVESRLLEAVHAGGAFVDLDGRSGGQVRAMVSPATPVRIEKVLPPTEPQAEGEDYPDLTFIDLMGI